MSPVGRNGVAPQRHEKSDEASGSMRNEQEIFDELAELCARPGYIHAIAWFCFRDNLVKVGDELKAKDLHNLFGDSRLIRTEISTLIGLAIKGAMDLSLPLPAVFQDYITRTEALLLEIHRSMTVGWFAGLTPEKAREEGFNPFGRGEAMREPIFYGGESAYGFQYRDFSVQKYVQDDAWIQASKGFSVEVARNVVKAACDLQAVKIPLIHQSFVDLHPDQWTFLPGFSFSVDELVAHSGIARASVKAVVESYSLPPSESNAGFRSLSDFNAVSAYPLIRTGAETFVLLQQYGWFEALYEAPFYWMVADDTYRPKAMGYRGQFTESFSRQRLESVFGAENVFANVDIHESKGKRLGEIDVLVVFGDRVIVLQAKSKRLTLEARKGNDLQIKEDFKKSVQDSYDQALLCANALGDPKYSLSQSEGRPIKVPAKIEEIYILCLVADHYPALSFQARQFLRAESSERIAPPFVLDVFTLDAIAEMLSSPLRFLSYVNRRTRYNEKVMAAHELTILSYHLRHNLWFSDRHDMVMLSDDISADLDVAMTSRREGLPGKTTPDGVLTRLTQTSIGRLISSIEGSPNPATIALGFMLLTVGEDSVRDISAGIDATVAAAKRDFRHHDFTAGIGDTGLTVHCNADPTGLSAERLRSHCERRKYAQKAGSWFGVCLSPVDSAARFGVSFKNKWDFNASMEASTRRMAKPGTIEDVINGPRRPRKLGRNDTCPCGSGTKYKKCCM